MATANTIFKDILCVKGIVVENMKHIRTAIRLYIFGSERELLPMRGTVAPYAAENAKDMVHRTAERCGEHWTVAVS